MLFVSCATQTTPPVDDAYYWEEIPVVSQPIQSDQPAPPAPTLEIISEQDTTITVRIKR